MRFVKPRWCFVQGRSLLRGQTPLLNPHNEIPLGPPGLAGIDTTGVLDIVTRIVEQRWHVGRDAKHLIAR